MRSLRLKRALTIKQRVLGVGCWVLAVVLLAGCGRADAGPILPLVVPTVAQAVAQPVLSPTPSLTPSITPTGTATLTPTPTLTSTPTPFPAGVALNPLTIDVTRPPTVSPLLTPPTPEIEWRPPPLAVPVAIHPQDHYWLARPIPSGSRNYDLDYYPFGNDVLIPEFAPFRIHHGIDFPNEEGTPVLSAADGRVIHAGPLPSPRDGINYYGNTIVIEHDWRWRDQPVFTLYAHTLEMFVRPGDRVTQGQLLAVVGGSGVVTGPHLHFEVRVGEDHYFAVRNPALWLAPYEGWGTLAGRFVDTRGELISNAEVTVSPLDVDVEVRPRRQRTYMDRRLVSDEVWNENFVVGDLPAGTYRVEIEMGSIEEGVELRRRYVDTVQVLPGRTNFLVVQADFIYVPTATPIPSPTSALTGTITSTIGITDTVGITETVPLETPSP